VTEWLKAALLELQEYLRLVAATTRALFTRPYYYRDIVEQFMAIGMGSMTVVLLTGTFTGMVLALQSGITLDMFGARSMVGRLVSASMVKELGPVLTALMVTGRVGSGKSTLVRSLVGLTTLVRGEVRLFGTALPRFRDWPRIGYVPQRAGATTGVPATVREVVSTGRLSRRGRLRRLSADDRAAITRAVATVDLADRIDDSVATLSGGQQQRVLIARANGVTTVFFEELVSPRVAEQLAREVGAEATVLNPLEGAPEEGDYLTAMRDNLAALQKALGCA